MNAPAESHLTRYIKAMVAGQLHVCIQIEKQFDLYGYSPEVVSVGLAAADEGRDVAAAVDEFLAGPAEDESE